METNIPMLIDSGSKRHVKMAFSMGKRLKLHLE